MSNGPIEPSAAQRTGAADLYRLFLALQQEGFTETQALTVIGTMLTATIQKPEA